MVASDKDAYQKNLSRAHKLLHAPVHHSRQMEQALHQDITLHQKKSHAQLYQQKQSVPGQMMPLTF